MAPEDEEDLQNEAAINNAYAALAIEEEGVEKELQALLAQQGELEGKVRGITKAIPNLEAVHSDAVRLADMISFTSNLAENVSAKVRRLDIARGRVSECQQRVHDLLDLQLCSEGVETALGAEDYEKAAAHVHRFLSMDTNILKQTADDMQQDCTSVSNSVRLLREAADKLRDIVTLRFNEAVHDEDLASVERFFKIFPLLGMHDYGLEKYSLYLSSKLEESSRKNLKTALNTSISDKRANVIYADTLTLLFEGVARVVEIHQPLVETYYGPGRLLTLVRHLQSECDRQSKAVLGEFRKHRLVERRVAQVRLASGRTGTAKLDPLELDVLLGEITIMHSRYNLYLRFIRRRVTADVEVGMSEASDRVAETHRLDTLLEGCELCRLMQELLGHYLPLEHYYMEESVKKAIAMDQLDQGSNTSSMVDDVFFIVRKCIRRASGSGSLDGVCAVINTACAILETEMCSALTQQLRLGFPSGYLDLTQAYNVVLQGRLQPSDSEHTKNTFLAYLNNADVSGEYVGTLCRSLVDEVPTGSAKERTKLESCLAGLSAVTAAMGAATELGLQQLRVSAVKPRVAPWVDGFLALSHNLSEEDFSSYEANDPFVRSLITNLDGLLSEFKLSLTPTNYDALVTILVAEVTSQMEKVICKTEFNRLGGLALDKEVRSLSGYLSSATSWSVRDKFSRLSQIATILNLERVAEMSDYWDSSALPWRLTPNEVKRILKLRIDFRSEDIVRLKL